MAASIRIGISAWAEPTLIKSGFYPPEVLSPAARLRHYAGRFSITEIDSTFYAFPMRRSLDLWLNNTPDGFLFNIKIFSLFTGHPTGYTSIPRAIRAEFGQKMESKGNIYLNRMDKEAADELWQAFASAVRPVKDAGKLGIVLFQFPTYFHFRPENLAYIAACREKMPGYRLAVEFRAGDWLEEKHRDQTLDLLRSLGITYVCVDEPQGLKSSVPPLAEVTAPVAMVRFHGRNQNNWESKEAQATDRFDYLYSEDELKEWVPKIKKISVTAQEVYLIFKNKCDDYPVQNAVSMKEMLGI